MWMNYSPQCSQKSNGILEQGSADLSCKGSDSKYFKFHGPHTVSHYPTLLCGKETTMCNILMNELCPSKALFTLPGIREEVVSAPWFADPSYEFLLMKDHG